jgi:hypothetical protein
LLKKWDKSKTDRKNKLFCENVSLNMKFKKKKYQQKNFYLIMLVIIHFKKLIDFFYKNLCFFFEALYGILIL